MADNKTTRSKARAREGVELERFPDDTGDRYLVVRCSECGAEVDKVEYPANEGPNPHVAQLVTLLGVEESKAAAILSEQNPELLRSGEERARSLVEQIVDRSVPDRGADTYSCPNGHDADLEVTE